MTSKRLSLAILTGILAFIATGLTGCTKDITDDDIKYISLANLRSELEGKNADKLLVVDSRWKGDYEAGHIPGAVNYDITEAKAKTGEGLNPVFARYEMLVVYGSERQSSPAKAMAKALMKAGADDVKMFDGGLMEWKRAGLKVESKQAAPAEPKPGAAK